MRPGVGRGHCSALEEEVVKGGIGEVGRRGRRRLQSQWVGAAGLGSGHGHQGEWSQGPPGVGFTGGCLLTEGQAGAGGPGGMEGLGFANRSPLGTFLHVVSQNHASLIDTELRLQKF